MPDVQAQVPTFFDKMTPQEAAPLILETNLTELEQNRKTEDPFPALLTLSDGSSFKATLSVRGRFRRIENKYPPLKVKVPKKALVAAGLDTLNELKLMLPHDDTRESGEYLVKEYLAYRMFETVSPGNSVRARLLKLTLKDSKTGKTNSMYALALEDKESLLARLNGREVTDYGNTDWGVHTNRNVRIVQTDGTDKLLVIPYDLDFSGLVNASYATPNSEYGLTNVRERFFMAHKLPETSLNAAVQRFSAAAETIKTLCQSPHLSQRSCKEMSGYLASFFKQITPEGTLKIGAAPTPAATGDSK
jgi:hypothetical protein